MHDRRISRVRIDVNAGAYRPKTRSCAGQEDCRVRGLGYCPGPCEAREREGDCGASPTSSPAGSSSSSSSWLARRPPMRLSCWFMVHAQVVDPSSGDGPGVLGEVRYAGPGHLEAEYLALDGLHHPRRVDVQRRRDQIPVEEVVEVLICRHPLHDRVALAVAQRLARVVVGDRVASSWRAR
jgi:hypothetical protein